MNGIQVEIIDGREYFVQRDDSGKVIMMEHKADNVDLDNNKALKITAISTGTLAGLSVLSLLANIFLK